MSEKPGWYAKPKRYWICIQCSHRIPYKPPKSSCCDYVCPACGGKMIRDRRPEAIVQGGLWIGPGGYCKCPSCGATAEHKVGTPCYVMECPECGEKMERVT